MVPEKKVKFSGNDVFNNFAHARRRWLKISSTELIIYDEFFLRLPKFYRGQHIRPKHLFRVETQSVTFGLG